MQYLSDPIGAFKIKRPKAHNHVKIRNFFKKCHLYSVKISVLKVYKMLVWTFEKNKYENKSDS